MAATGLANQLNTFKNRDDCKCLFKRNTVPLKILDHCKWPPKIMVVPLKCMAASVPLKQKYALNRNICQINFIYSSVDTRRRSNVYKTSIRRRRRRIDILQTLKRRRVLLGELMVAGALLKNDVFIEEWLAATAFFK